MSRDAHPVLTDIAISRGYLVSLYESYRSSLGFLGIFTPDTEAMRKLKVFYESTAIDGSSETANLSFSGLLQLSFIICDGLEESLLSRDKFNHLVEKMGLYWPIFKTICQIGISAPLQAAFTTFHPSALSATNREKASHIIAHLCEVLRKAKLEASARPDLRAIDSSFSHNSIAFLMLYAHYFCGNDTTDLTHAALRIFPKIGLFSKAELNEIFDKLATSTFKFNIAAALIKLKENHPSIGDQAFWPENLRLIFAHPDKAGKISSTLCVLKLMAGGSGLSVCRVLFAANIQYVDLIDFFMSKLPRPSLHHLSRLLNHAALLHRFISTLNNNDKLNMIFSKDTPYITEFEGIDEAAIFEHLITICELSQANPDLAMSAFRVYFENIIFSSTGSDLTNRLSEATCANALQHACEILRAPIPFDLLLLANPSRSRALFNDRLAPIPPHPVRPRIPEMMDRRERSHLRSVIGEAFRLGGSSPPAAPRDFGTRAHRGELFFPRQSSTPSPPPFSNPLRGFFLGHAEDRAVSPTLACTPGRPTSTPFRELTTTAGFFSPPRSTAASSSAAASGSEAVATAHL